MSLPPPQITLLDEQPEQSEHYRYGEIVTVHNLASESGAVYNGATGILETYNRDTDRFVVYIAALVSGDHIARNRIKLRRQHVTRLCGTSVPAQDASYVQTVHKFLHAIRIEYPGFLNFQGKANFMLEEHSIQRLKSNMLESTRLGLCELELPTNSSGGNSSNTPEDLDDVTDVRFSTYEAMLLGVLRLLWNKKNPPDAAGWKQLYQQYVLSEGHHVWSVDVKQSTDPIVQGRALRFCLNFGIQIGANLYHQFMRYSTHLVKSKNHPVFSANKTRMSCNKVDALRIQLERLSPKATYKTFRTLGAGSNYAALLDNKLSNRDCMKNCEQLKTFFEQQKMKRMNLLNGVSREHLEKEGLLDAVCRLLLYELNGRCFRLHVVQQRALAPQQSLTTEMQIAQILVSELVYYTSFSNTYQKSREAMAFLGIINCFRHSYDEALHYLTACKSLYQSKPWTKTFMEMHMVTLGMVETCIIQVRTAIICAGGVSGLSPYANGVDQKSKLWAKDKDHPLLPEHLRNKNNVRKGTWCRAVSKKGVGSSGNKKQDQSILKALKPKCGTANCMVGSKMYMFGGISIEKINPIPQSLPLLHRLFLSRIECNGTGAGQQRPTNDMMIYDLKTGIWESVVKPSRVNETSTIDEHSTSTGSTGSSSVRTKKKKNKKKKKKAKTTGTNELVWPDERGFANFVHVGGEDNGLYLCGGRTLWNTTQLSKQKFLRDMWRFDLVSNTWTQIVVKDSPRILTNCASVVVKGVWFFIDPNSSECNRRLPKTVVRCFDIARRKWHLVADKKISYSKHAEPHVSPEFGKVKTPVFM